MTKADNRFFHENEFFTISHTDPHSACFWLIKYVLQQPSSWDNLWQSQLNCRPTSRISDRSWQSVLGAERSRHVLHLTLNGDRWEVTIVFLAKYVYLAPCIPTLILLTWKINAKMNAFLWHYRSPHFRRLSGFVRNSDACREGAHSHKSWQWFPASPWMSGFVRNSGACWEGR